MNYLDNILNKEEFIKPNKLKEFVISTYDDQLDYQNLIKLYHLIFPKLKTENLIIWKNKKNPFGSGEPFIFLMKYKGEIIAHYSVIPKLFYFYGNKIPCVQSMGTMTHPKYQGRGISSYLAKVTYEYCKKAGYNFVFGFPNEKSIQMFEKKLGWINFGKMSLLKKKINSDFLNNDVQNKYEIKEVYYFTNEIDGLWNKSKNSIPIIIKKDQKYLNWRYVSHPFVNYKKLLVIHSKNKKIIAYFILKRYNSDYKEVYGHIVDFLISSTDNINENEIFSFIEKYSIDEFRKDCSEISFWVPNETLKTYALENLGFSEVKMSTYFGFKKLIDNEKLNILNDFNNWYITMDISDNF